MTTNKSLREICSYIFKIMGLKDGDILDAMIQKALRVPCNTLKYQAEWDFASSNPFPAYLKARQFHNGKIEVVLNKKLLMFMTLKESDDFMAFLKS
jgi:hypothetical protein